MSTTSTTLSVPLGISTPKPNGTSEISSIIGLFLFETAPLTEPKDSFLLLLVPFICLSKRNKNGDDRDGDGGGGGAKDDEDHDGVGGGRPWRTLGQ
jgi:hypothetical protein